MRYWRRRRTSPAERGGDVSVAVTSSRRDSPPWSWSSHALNAPGGIVATLTRTTMRSGGSSSAREWVRLLAGGQPRGRDLASGRSHAGPHLAGGGAIVVRA